MIPASLKALLGAALVAIAACKTAVAEYTGVKASAPANITQAGCSTTATKSMAALNVGASGVITATKRATGASPECTFGLTPTVSGASIPTWTGTFATCASKYVTSSFR